MNKDDAREAAAIHELKTWPQYFQAITSGEKTFEIRKNDRGFKVGDTLRLCNYDPDLGRFTGHTVERKIAYIAQGVFGLPDDVCVMSLAGAASVDRRAVVELLQAWMDWYDGPATQGISYITPPLTKTRDALADEQLTQDANFAEAIGQASDRAFAADLRTVINAARSREQYATKQIQIQTPRIKAPLEAENALLKKKLEIALRGLDEYGDEKNWSHVDGWPQAFDKALRGYELARRIKAEIEEVK